MHFFGLGLALGVPAPRVLSALLAAALRSAAPSSTGRLHLDGWSWPARLKVQLEFFGWWWNPFTRLPSLLDALRAHEGAAEEVLASLEEACEQVGPLDEATRPWVSYARLLLGGASAEDHELVITPPKGRYVQEIAALAAVRDRRLRQRLVLEATSTCHEQSKRNLFLDIIRDAGWEQPSSVRSEVEAICSAWLAEDDPAVRLWALDELRRFGWIDQVHLQPLLHLLDGPIGAGWYGSESDFRRLCGELILKHFPEHAAALHKPLLAVLPGQGSWSLQTPSIPALLAQAGCPRAPLLAGIRRWFGEMAEGKLQSHPNLRDIRAMLDEHELFDELAADFADLLVGQLKELTDVALDGLIPGDELSLEPDPRRGAGWDGNPVERKRLKHVPALLAGALARRLEVDEDAVQTLWTAVGVRDESCTATFHHVVQQATSDPVLRPFAVMLVERWESSQAASS